MAEKPEDEWRRVQADWDARRNTVQGLPPSNSTYERPEPFTTIPKSMANEPQGTDPRPYDGLARQLGAVPPTGETWEAYARRQMERILRGRGTAEREDNEDRQRKIAEAIEKSAEDKTVAEGSWTPDDWAVAAIGALIAVPLCDAGWHAVVNEPEHFVRGWTAIAIGLPLGLVAFSFHRWKTKISAEARNQIGAAALKWWPVAIFLAFGYFAIPVVYQRAINPPSATTAAPAGAPKESRKWLSSPVLGWPMPAGAPESRS